MGAGRQATSTGRRAPSNGRWSVCVVRWAPGAERRRDQMPQGANAETNDQRCSVMSPETDKYTYVALYVVCTVCSVSPVKNNILIQSSIFGFEWCKGSYFVGFILI